MKNERVRLQDVRGENPLSLLTRLLSKWLKLCSQEHRYMLLKQQESPLTSS